jgi:hypothetical protein
MTCSNIATYITPLGNGVGFNMTLDDTGFRLFANYQPTEKSRKKLQRLIEDLNLEITSMPTALRNPFRIVRDMVIEMSGE